MKTSQYPATIASPTRRGFIRNLAVAGGAAALAPIAAMGDHNGAGRPQVSCWLAKRFSFEATGVSTFDYVVPFLWPPILPPKAVAEQLGIPFWISYKFPCRGRDIMSMEVSMLSQADPTQFELVSQALVRVDEITVGPPVVDTAIGAPPSPTPDDGIPEPSGPMPTFSLLGRIIESGQDSPFGTVVGRTMTLSAAFDREGTETCFYLLGGAAAGSHASYLRKAKGLLRFHGFGH